MDFFEGMQILKDGGKIEHSVGISRIVLSLEPVRPGQPKVLMATGYQGNQTRYRRPLFPVDYLMKSWEAVDMPKKQVVTEPVEEKKVEEVENVVVKKPRAKKSSKKQEKVVTAE